MFNCDLSHVSLLVIPDSNHLIFSLLLLLLGSWCCQVAPTLHVGAVTEQIRHEAGQLAPDLPWPKRCYQKRQQNGTQILLGKKNRPSAATWVAQGAIRGGDLLGVINRARPSPELGLESTHMQHCKKTSWGNYKIRYWVHALGGYRLPMASCF